jgi:transcriptional regulator with XRE-family HTH domain
MKRESDMSCKEIFAKRIKELRDEKDLGLNQLANKLGIGSSSLSQYENCKRTPDIDVCKMFADFFGVTCDYLIGITDERNKK